MSKLIFDFDNCEVTRISNNGESRQFIPELNLKRDAILTAAGLKEVSVQPMFDAINSMLSGELSPEEAAVKLRDWENE